MSLKEKVLSDPAANIFLDCYSMIMNIEALFFRGLAIEINFFFRTAYKGDSEISQQCNQFKHGFFRFVMRAANFWCVQIKYSHTTTWSW